MNMIEIQFFLNMFVFTAYSLYCAIGRRGVGLYMAGGLAITAMFGLTLQMAEQA